MSHVRLVAQACSTLQHRIAIVSIIFRLVVRFRLRQRRISMSQSLAITKLGQQSNSGMLLKRTFITPFEGPGLARYDKVFIRKYSDRHALVSASSTSVFISSRKPAVKIFAAHDSDLSLDRARQIEKKLADDSAVPLRFQFPRGN